MLPNDEVLFDLIGSIYEAAASPERCGDFLELAARIFACDRALLTIHDRQRSHAQLQLGYGFNPDEIQQYNTYFGVRNPAVGRVFACVHKIGSWNGLARSLVCEKEYERTEYYNDFGRKNGLYWAAYGSIANSPDNVSTLSVARARKDPPLDGDAVELMGFLLPHLKRVLKIHRAMEALRSSANIGLAALDAIEVGLITVNGKGEPVLMNTRADGILRKADGVCLAGRRLSASNPSMTSKFDSLIRRTAATGAGQGFDAGGAMLLDRRKGHPLRVSVVPFHSSHMLTEVGASALVFIDDPDERPASRSAILSALYHLTPAECRLADLFASGLGLTAVSDQMRITRGTVRFMLKSIFAKTGMHRQSELMRLLMRLPGNAQR